MHGLCWTYHRVKNHFGRTQWNSLVTWVIWNLASFHLETLLGPVQDRCMLCSRCTIGSGIILDTPDGTTRLKWELILVLSDILVILTQDRCTVYVERAIGSEIVLDTPVGTPKWHESCGISLLSLWTQCLCRCKICARFMPNVPSAQDLFWMDSMVLLVDEAQVKARFTLFEDSANLDAS
jgi:hypothetical protein